MAEANVRPPGALRRAWLRLRQWWRPALRSATVSELEFILKLQALQEDYAKLLLEKRKLEEDLDVAHRQVTGLIGLITVHERHAEGLSAIASYQKEMVQPRGAPPV